MHSFEVHSNESACRKSGRLALEQVINECNKIRSLIQNVIERSIAITSHN